MTPAEHTARLRRHARALAACEGWTDWALPALQKAVEKLDQQILEDTTLRGTALDDARAARQALRGFLMELHTTAETGFTNPPTEDSEILPQSLPEEVAKALSLTVNGGQLTVTRERSESAPPTVPPATGFSPFAGLPQPVPPTPTPATKEP